MTLHPCPSCATPHKVANPANMCATCYLAGHSVPSDCGMTRPTFTVGSRVSLTIRNGTHYTPEPGTTTQYGTVLELNVPNPPARGCTTRVSWDGDAHYNPRIGHAAPDYLVHVPTTVR